MRMQRHQLSGIAAALALALLAGCAAYVPPVAAPDAPAAAETPALAAEGGGYYLDDGPPDEAASVAAADAVVRAEKINPAHNRPYVVLGKRYIPFTSLQPYRKRGIASWYGRRYHGRPTASGERYDMHKMTAAHPILPIPSYARVTRTATGASVVVRINDRGPFLQGREIDLSYAAATRLDIVNSGTGEVIVETILPAGQPAPAGAAGDSGGTVEEAAALGEAVYVQLAAFATPAQAQEFIRALRAALPPRLAALLEVHQKRADLYAVQVGPYDDHAAAARADGLLCEQHGHCGFLTRRYQ